MSEQLLVEILGEIKSVKAVVISLNARLDQMDARLDRIESRQGKMDARLDNLETRLENVEVQLSEANQIVKSLLHKAEETDAQLHSLGHALTQVQGRLSKTATKADIDSLAEDINFVMKKVANHDTDIRQLRRASYKE